MALDIISHSQPNLVADCQTVAQEYGLDTERDGKKLTKTELRQLICAEERLIFWEEADT